MNMFEKVAPYVANGRREGMELQTMGIWYTMVRGSLKLASCITSLCEL